MLEPVLFIFGLASGWLLVGVVKLPFVWYGLMRPMMPAAFTKQGEDRILLVGFVLTGLIWLGLCFGLIALFDYMHI